MRRRKKKKIILVESVTERSIIIFGNPFFFFYSLQFDICCILHAYYTYYICSILYREGVTRHYNRRAINTVPW